MLTTIITPLSSPPRSPNQPNYPTGLYWIKVRAIDSNNSFITNGVSNYFPLFKPLTITVTAPTAGNIYPSPSSFLVNWKTSSDVPASNQMMARLYTATGQPLAVTHLLGSNDDSEMMSIPSGLTTGNYYLEVDTGNNMSGVDVPPGKSVIFSINGSTPSPPVAPPATPTLKVTKPSTGNTWKAGSQKVVLWTSTGLATSTDLPTNAHPRMIMKLFKADGTASPVPISPIIQGGNDGNQTITLPLAPPGSYYIELDTTNTNSPDVPPARSGVFTLYSPP